VRTSLLPNLNMLDHVLSFNNFDPLLPRYHRRSIELIEQLGEQVEEIERIHARRAGREVAEGLIGELFRIAFERRKSFDSSYPSARPWLYGIAANLLQKHRRAEARRLRANARLAAEGRTSDGGRASRGRTRAAPAPRGRGGDRGPAGGRARGAAPYARLGGAALRRIAAALCVPGHGPLAPQPRAAPARTRSAPEGEQ
jgi:RNA polymerase sigma-70 factor (ECF subfamily)